MSIIAAIGTRLDQRILFFLHLDLVISDPVIWLEALVANLSFIAQS
jgi:hypothetical protein